MQLFFYYLLTFNYNYYKIQQYSLQYNIGNEEPAIILKDKNKFENLKPTIWFEVEDVAIFYKEMLNNGIKFLSEPFKIGTGNAVEFEDPFGNRLGVTDYIK